MMGNTSISMIGLLTGIRTLVKSVTRALGDMPPNGSALCCGALR